MAESSHYRRPKSEFRIDFPKHINYGFDVIDRHPGNDRMLLMLPFISQSWHTLLRLMKLADEAIPCTVSLRSKDIEFRFNIANVKRVINDPANAAKFDKVLDPIPTVKHFVLVSGKIQRVDLQEREIRKMEGS